MIMRRCRLEGGFTLLLIESCHPLQPEPLACYVEMLTFLELRGDVNHLLTLEDWKR